MSTVSEFKDGPLLSVVIPVYNVTQYLDQCISSVLAQGFEAGELEIIVVDDGSTDGSNLISEKWAKRNDDIIVLRRQNGGLSAARNSGLDASRGEFLTFLDSDDIVPNGAYRKMLDVLRESGSDFITSGPYRFAWWNRLAQPFARNADLFLHPGCGLTLDSNPEYLRDFTAWNKIYRRDFFIESEVRFPEGRIYEDVATSPFLYRRARAFDVFAGPGLFWRVTPGGITQTIKPVKAVDRLWALSHIQSFLAEDGASEPILNELGFAILDYNLRWVFLEYHRFDEETRALILDEAQRLLLTVPDSVIAQVQSPLNEWGMMAKTGRKAELAGILGCPPLDLPDLPLSQVSEQPVTGPKPKTSRTPTMLRSMQHRLRRDLKRRVQNVFIYTILRPIFMSLPILRHTAVFSAYWGQKFSLSDGPAAICLELNRYNPSFLSIVFASKNSIATVRKNVEKLSTNPNRIKVVRNYSLAYYYYLWRSKYLFNDVNFQLAFRVDRGTKKRRGQVEIQTTHGIPIKKMGIDSDQAIDPSKKTLFLNRSKRYDHLVSTSPSVATKFALSHGVDPHIMQTGLPQHDVFFAPPSEQEVRETKQKYGIDPSKRIVLYAPTFRNNKGSAFPYLLDIHELQELLGDSYQFVLKPHPFNHTRLETIDFRELTDYAVSPKQSPFVVLMGKIRVDDDYLPVTMDRDRARSNTTYTHVDGSINDLLFASDIVVTDYSSLMFGYTHLNKPLVLFTPDIEHYDSTRGSYYDVDKIAPGPVAKSTQELARAIRLSEEPEAWSAMYDEKRKVFMEEFLLWDQGDASAKVLRELGIEPA